MKVESIIQIAPFPNNPERWVDAVIVSEDSEYFICEYSVGTVVKMFSFMKDGWQLDKQVRVK